MAARKRPPPQQTTPLPPLLPRYRYEVRQRATDWAVFAVESARLVTFGTQRRCEQIARVLNQTATGGLPGSPRAVGHAEGTQHEWPTQEDLRSPDKEGAD